MSAFHQRDVQSNLGKVVHFKSVFAPVYKPGLPSPQIAIHGWASHLLVLIKQLFEAAVPYGLLDMLRDVVDQILGALERLELLRHYNLLVVLWRDYKRLLLLTVKRDDEPIQKSFDWNFLDFYSFSFKTGIVRDQSPLLDVVAVL